MALATVRGLVGLSQVRPPVVPMAVSRPAAYLLEQYGASARAEGGPVRRDGVVLVAAFIAGLLSTAEALDDTPACGWPTSECSVQRESGAAVAPGGAAVAPGAGAEHDEVPDLSAWFEPAPVEQPPARGGG